MEEILLESVRSDPTVIRSRKLEPLPREEFPPCWALSLVNNLHSPGNLQGHHPRVYWDKIPHIAILVSCQSFPDLPSLYSTTISLIPQTPDDFLTYIPSSDLSIELLLCTGWSHPDVQWMLQTNMLKATLSLTDFHQPLYRAFFSILCLQFIGSPPTLCLSQKSENTSPSLSSSLPIFHIS